MNTKKLNLKFAKCSSCGAMLKINKNMRKYLICNFCNSYNVLPKTNENVILDF